MRAKPSLLLSIIVGAFMLSEPWATRAAAHCDGLDGPVVRAAERALETGNIDLVLIWVSPNDEQEIRAAFGDAARVRPLGADARRLADRYFFETVVRLHRVGEGEPYTGLKPAGRDLGPAIPAADRAIETADPDPLATLLSETVRHGLEERYARLMAKRRYDPSDRAAGRAYVAAYVEFIHYVERLHEAATLAAHGHYPEAAH